jgi:GNAT superfamily N-acetyltransferase
VVRSPDLADQPDPSPARWTVAIVGNDVARELRRAVLRPQLSEADPLPGDDLPEAVHFAVLDPDGQAAGTCFVYPEPCPWRPDVLPSWRLRQMATAPGLRDRGIGTAILTAAVGWCAAKGGRLLWCNAREGAVAFYARQGFRPYGPTFTDERHTIPHQRMSLELAPRPRPATEHR